ncbi:MAG: DUF1854 domain-containing protein [Planctomycetota bacterium]
MVDANFADLSFRKNEWGQLVLVMLDGVEYPGIDPVRCFPLTDPEHVIALLDQEGKELINLPSLDVLKPESREFIQRELAERDFVPVIRKIITTSAPYPPCIWNVETDRGKTSFHLESEDDIRSLGKTGIVIADSNGIRYKVVDISALDASSRRIVRQLV